MSYHYLRNPDAYTIRKEYHTKLEKDYYLVVPTGRLGDEFGDFRASAKAAGGWYSRKYRRVPGGFAFNTRQEAADWAAEAFGESGADGEAGGAESAAEAPPAVRPLYGHTTEATAYKQTVGGKTRAYWLEYKKGKGYRFVSRTVAPRLTKPVMSTYSDGAAAMYLNENGDVRWSGLSLGHGDGSEYLRFLNNFPGIDDRQLCALYDWARVKVAYNKDQAKEPYFEPEYYQNNIEVWGKVVAKAKSIWVDQKKASKLATAPAAPAPEAEKKPEKAADTAKMTAEEYTAAISKAIKQRKKTLGVKSVSQGYKGTGSRAAHRLIGFDSLDGKMVQLSLTGGGWGFTNVYRTDLSNVSQRRGTFTGDLKTDANQIRKALAQWTGVLPPDAPEAPVWPESEDPEARGLWMSRVDKPGDLNESRFEDAMGGAGEAMRRRLLLYLDVLVEKNLLSSDLYDKAYEVHRDFTEDEQEKQKKAPALPGGGIPVGATVYVTAMDGRDYLEGMFRGKVGDKANIYNTVTGMSYTMPIRLVSLTRPVGIPEQGKAPAPAPAPALPGGFDSFEDPTESFTPSADPLDTYLREIAAETGAEGRSVAPNTVLRGDGLSVPRSGVTLYEKMQGNTVLDRAWMIQVDAANEGTAIKLGEKAQKNLIPKTKVAASAPLLHDAPLYVIYENSWIKLAGLPDSKKPAPAPDVKAPVVPSPTPAPPADTTRTTQVVLGVGVRKMLPHFDVYATLTPTTAGGSASVKVARFSYTDRADADAAQAAAERYAQDLEYRYTIALLDGASAHLEGWISAFCGAGKKILVGPGKGSVLACSKDNIETIQGWAQNDVEYIDKHSVTRSFGRSDLIDVYELGGDTASLLAGELAFKAEDTVNGLLERYENAVRDGNPGDPSSLDAALSLDKKIRDLLTGIRSATPPSKTEARKLIDTQKATLLDTSKRLSKLASQAGFLAVHDPRHPLKDGSMTTRIEDAVRFRERHPVGVIADEYDTRLNLFEDLYTSTGVKGKSGKGAVVELSLTTQKGRRDEMIKVPPRQYFIDKRTSSAPATSLFATNKIWLKAVEDVPGEPSKAVLVWEGSSGRGDGTLSAEIPGGGFNRVLLDSLRLLPEQGKAAAPAAASPVYPEHPNVPPSTRNAFRKAARRPGELTADIAVNLLNSTYDNRKPRYYSYLLHLIREGLVPASVGRAVWDQVRVGNVYEGQRQQYVADLLKGLASDDLSSSKSQEAINALYVMVYGPLSDRSLALSGATAFVESDPRKARKLLEKIPSTTGKKWLRDLVLSPLEDIDGKTRWMRPSRLQRADGEDKKITIYTDVVSLEQKQASGGSQGPVPAGLRGKVKSTTTSGSGQSRAKDAIGVKSALSVAFEPLGVPRRLLYPTPAAAEAPYPFEVGDLIEKKETGGARQIFRVTENDAFEGGSRYFSAGPVHPTLFPAIWENIPPWSSIGVKEDGGLSGDWDDYKLWTPSEDQKNVTKASKVLRELREAGVESITLKALERDYGVRPREVINSLHNLYPVVYEERNGSNVWTIFTTPEQEALRRIWSEHPYLEAPVAVQRVTEDMVSRIKPGTPVAFAAVGNQGEDTKTEFFPEDFRYAVVESADLGNIQLEPTLLGERGRGLPSNVQKAATAQYLPKTTGYRKTGPAKREDEKGLHLYVQTSSLQAPKAPAPAPAKPARRKSKPVQAAEALGRAIRWYVTEHQPKWAPRGVLIIGPFKRAWQKFKVGRMSDPKPLDGMSQADFDAIKAMKDTSYGPGISGSHPGVKIPVKLRNAMIEALREQGLTVNVALDDNGRYESMEIINPYSPYALLEAVRVRLSEHPNADVLLPQLFNRRESTYRVEAERLLAPETSNPRYTRRW